MKIGIITPPKAYKRQNFLKRTFRVVTIEEIKNDINPFDLMAGIIPFPEEKLKRMPPQKLERCLFRGKAKLKLSGAEAIVYSDFLKALC